MCKRDSGRSERTDNERGDGKWQLDTEGSGFLQAEGLGVNDETAEQWNRAKPSRPEVPYRGHPRPQCP